MAVLLCFSSSKERVNIIPIWPDNDMPKCIPPRCLCWPLTRFACLSSARVNVLKVCIRWISLGAAYFLPRGKAVIIE
jgi:hypothetical protein